MNEFERAPAGHGVVLENLRPRDVGGHEIRRELDPAELQIQDLRQGRNEQGLREPGHAHEQAVAVREEHRKELLHHGVLAHDDFAQFAENGAARVFQILQKLEIVLGDGLRHDLPFRDIPRGGFRKISDGMRRACA
jgi:hypothetical protein